MSMSRRNRWLGRARRVVGRPRLIFVLGSQRSGTNALRQSLSLDPWVRGFNEHKSNRLYDNWVLRPEPEIRWFLRRQPGTVLLKPIRSVIDRPVSEFLAEFADYRYEVAWIYRDPVLVFASRRRRWAFLDDVEHFTTEWNRINRSALAARDDRMAIVSHADLIADRAVFEGLCGFLDVNGEYLFRRETSRAYEEVDGGDIDRIHKATAETRAALDGARAFTAG
jgi:hypothetical protein